MCNFTKSNAVPLNSLVRCCAGFSVSQNPDRRTNKTVPCWKRKSEWKQRVELQ